MNNTTKRVFPIKFERLFVGSEFTIFAEPSRGVRKSNDKTTYRKMAESWSEDVNDPNHVAILMPEDLVQPLNRGPKQT